MGKQMFTEDKEKNTEILNRIIRENGLSDGGFAELDTVREYIHPSLLEVMPGKITGSISFVFHLSDAIMSTLDDHPTPLYGFHYNRVNSFIDQTVLKISSWIQDDGYEALPIPASQVIDKGSQRGYVMHKLMAVGAGLGWIGRSNLFVTEKFGARVRLATLFTNLPLVPNEEIPFSCGECRACIERCPAEAIKEKSEDFRLDLCEMKIKSFQRLMFVTKGICGVCQSACPPKRK